MTPIWPQITPKMSIFELSTKNAFDWYVEPLHNNALSWKSDFESFPVIWRRFDPLQVKIWPNQGIWNSHKFFLQHLVSKVVTHYESYFKHLH